MLKKIPGFGPGSFMFKLSESFTFLTRALSQLKEIIKKEIEETR